MLKMVTSTKETGKRGEDIAADYLKNKGYRILQRNYIPSWFKQGRKEIDIVVQKGGLLVFVEVKTGHRIYDFVPEDHIDYKKQRFLAQAGESYLLEKNIPEKTEWQIDVVSVILDRNNQVSKISHFENVIGE